MTTELLVRGGTLEQLAGGHVKGGMVRAHMDWVREYHGEAALERALDRLRMPVRRELETAVATTWCSFDALIALDRAIQDCFGRGRDLMRELGRYSAHRNLSTTYRLFLRSDVHEFFHRSALLHTQFQDFGRVESHRLGATRCELRHTGARCFSPLYCASALGYYEQVVIMHGAKNVTVEEVLCQCRGDEACIFRLCWD